MIFIKFAFSKEEIQKIFDQFILKFTQNQQFWFPNFISICDYMAKENLLGKKVFEKIIFPSMGVEIRDFSDEEAVFSL